MKDKKSNNKILRFFSRFSSLQEKRPRKQKQTSIIVCCAVIIVGVIVSAIMAPVATNLSSEQAASETTVEETTQAPTEPALHKIEGIPLIQQDYYKAACETYACVMLLQGLGYKMDMDTFINKYLIQRFASWDENGTMYAADMDAAYVGDVFSGWGINAPAMAKSMNQFLTKQSKGQKAYPIVGNTLAQLAEEYVKNGIPVMTWVTTYMQESYVKNSWVIDYVDENCKRKVGDTAEWRQNEHCMVMIGYDDKNYIFNDSVANKVVSHPKELCETRFKEIGQQAVVVK